MNGNVDRIIVGDVSRSLFLYTLIAMIKHIIATKSAGQSFLSKFGQCSEAHRHIIWLELTPSCVMHASGHVWGGGGSANGSGERVQETFVR